MAKPIPQKHRKRPARKKSLPTTMICGFDQSMRSIAGAAIAWDETLKRWTGPEFIIVRWNKEDEYYDRISEAGTGHEMIWDLQRQLKLGNCEPENVFIAQEEPFPMGMINRRGGKTQGQTLKQQAEISGAFLHGLLKYNFRNIYQINSVMWRQIVADDLGITIGTKRNNPKDPNQWSPKDPKLYAELNCRAGEVGKWRSKQWALSSPGPGYGWMHAFPNEIPEWPDLIDSKKEGMIPRPKNSKAKAVQPDDRYDALAVMEWMRQEWERGRV